jgi:hypothetical protein
MYCGHFVYILWLFGIFSPFWYVVPRKIWQHWLPLRPSRLHKTKKYSFESAKGLTGSDLWRKTIDTSFEVSPFFKSTKI